MAHPKMLGLDPASLELELRRLKEIGLGGLECYYSLHSPEEEESFIALARKVGLVLTGGSDFHGKSKPTIHLGIVTGGGPVSHRILDELSAARA
jgi:predicted metal-dependent phosphoesterase TrpH